MNGPMITTSPSLVKPPMTRPVWKSEADVLTPNRILGWLKLYWLTILFCGGLLGGGLAYAAWELLPAKYESYALLRVASSPFTVTNQKDPTRSRTDFNTYLKTNAKLIRNEFVLNKALNMEVDGRRIIDLPTIQAQENPIQWLDDELVVTHTDGVEIITISLKGHNPDDIRRIVNAVQMAYMEEVIEKEIHERQAFLTTVETTLVRLQQDLAKMVGKPDDAIMPVGGVPAPLPGGIVNANQPIGPPEWVKREMAANLVKKAAVLRENVAELPLIIASQKQKVANLEKQLASLRIGPPSKEVLEEIDRDPDVIALAQREQTYRAKHARELALYANPNAESVQATLALADEAAQDLKKLKDKKIHERETGRRQTKANELATLIDEANRRLRDLEDKLRADTLRLAEAETEIARMPSDPAKIVEEKKEKKEPIINPESTMIVAQDDIFRDMAHHAAALRMDINSPKRVSVLQKASMPVQKDFRKQVLLTVLAGLMGFALVGLTLVGYEARVRKLSTLADLKMSTMLPVAGVLPWRPGDPKSSPDVLEAVDRLRAYVSQTWLARGATTVVVTSALGDEGKSFTAFGLASSLASSGCKTLLVDFDLREPSLHALTGGAASPGVCELLRGESDFRGTIQRLPSGLHFLPTGQWSEDARHAAVGGRLESLLSRLKEPFDCVILHTHALLTAAEAVEVARRCEVVLLCTLCRQTQSPMLRRAAERVASMEVPYSGVVYLGATRQESLC